MASGGGEPGRDGAQSVTQYGTQLLRVAVALIVRENPGGTVGFNRVETSAFEALVDMCTRYIRTIGTISAQAAQHAGRSESNFLDVQIALDAMGSPSLHEFMAFSRESNLPFVHGVPAFPVVRDESSSAAVVARPKPRPAFVPEYLPPFPDEVTFQHTAQRNTRPRNALAGRKQRSKLKRQAQDALLALEQKVSSSALAAAFPTSSKPAVSVGEGTGAGAGKPRLADEDEDVMLEGSALQSALGSGQAPGVTSMLEVPDVLAGGQPAVLQSSEAYECCGSQSSVALPMLTVHDDRPIDVHDSVNTSAAPNAKRSKADAILNLQHRHDLEEVAAMGALDDD